MRTLLSYMLLFSVLLFSIQLNGQEIKKTKSDPNVPIFEIKNDLGQTVFAVYPGGVKIFIDEQLKAAGGGFSVGRLGTGKATSDDFFIVNPGDVRVNLPEPIGKATAGGFTVGRLGTGKALGDEDFLKVTPDSTRIYTVETSNKGFAAGKLNAVKGVENFLNLTKENYFIGHNSGVNNIGGLYNLFLGYESGFSNNADGNTFIGFQSGFSNETGKDNVYIGYESGHSNTNGSLNVFIGYRAGRDSDSSAHDNVFIGFGTALNKTKGSSNVMLGKFTGVNTGISNNNVIIGDYAGAMIEHVYSAPTALDNNVIIGHYAGRKGIGTNNVVLGTYAGYNQDAINSTGNVFLGYSAGYSESGSNRLYIDNSSTASPLIFGEFDNNEVVINGNSADNPSNYNFYVNGTSGGDFSWISTSDVRLKRNIINITNALEKVLQLRGVSFNWKDTESFDSKTHIGFLAQEVEKVIPEVVSNTNDNYSMQYSPITALLVEAIKEQNLLMLKLEERVLKLEESNESLKGGLEKMKQLESDIEELKSFIGEMKKE